MQWLVKDGWAHLVELQTNQTRDERRRGGYCGNDLTSDLLSGMSIGDRDIVVHGTEIGCSGNEVNMMVGIVIFLEFYWVEPISCHRRWCRKSLRESGKVIVGYEEFSIKP